MLQGPEILETSWQDLEILGNVSIVRIIALAAKVAETWIITIITIEINKIIHHQKSDF